ncbi:MAG: hypothetical protein MUE61_07010 [Vicinamibacterales bacterium]|nr:hypothetical protein [Vicinamibacterales bacterium]
MRISFDMDGVLADMDATLARLAEQEFGVTARTGVPQSTERDPAGAAGEEATDAPPPYDTALLNALSARQQSRLWQRVRDTRNFWETLEECEPGAVRRIQRLAHELRWDVLFVTQRPGTAGRTQQLQTQHWLKRRGFEYPAVYTTIGSRGAIAAALTLDAHIDDRLQNCVDVATESKAWPILVWRDAESFDRIGAGARNLGIAVVRTVAEALDRIEQADRASSQPEGPSLLDRLRRAFR